MRYVTAEEVQKYLPWQDTVESLRKMFKDGCVAPVRHHHAMQHPDQPESTMLLMPAWVPGKYVGLKFINVYPNNFAKGVPTINGVYLLMEGETGVPIVNIDAGELTSRRTVAASALAADYLSRKDAKKMLIVGSGRLSRYLGFAYKTIRDIDEIKVWARDPEKSAKIVQVYADAGFKASVSTDLQEDAGWADIISCVTPSTEPIIKGAWLKPGCHVDLIGGFKPNMRETDDEVVVKSSVFVDTREGVLAEAGDLLIPMENGVFKREDILAELSQLTNSEHQGRKDDDEITLFKSVGASLEDLAAAITCYENMNS
ncbi:MAG: ornithine cyclodeaminase family protein [Desulfotalea sp.]